MRRREFITLVSGTVASWPLVARAQSAGRTPLVGFLEPISADTPGAKARETAFLEDLKQLGWTPGQNLRVEFRWSGGDEAETRKNAAELVALGPDVIVTAGSAGAGVMVKATHTIPIVFAIVPDPVGSGFVESLSRPGGNATGFMMFEYSLCGKWLELLKQIAPTVTRAAVLRDPDIAAGIGQFAVIQSVAPSVGIDVSPIDLREPAQIERAIARYAQSSNGGMIVTASAIAAVHIDLIIAAAARYKLPAIYVQRAYAAAGGLMSYGPCMDGARVARGNLTFLRSVRVRSCIRPVVAWRLASIAMQPLWPLALM